MVDPVIKNIEVPCCQKDAFTIFVNKIEQWWPMDKHSVSAMKGTHPKSLVLQPMVGGKVFEIELDDTLHPWGTVTTYDPYSKFAMDWHIGRPEESATQLEVQFLIVDEKRTKVTLIHRNWESFGEKAAETRASYNNGWVLVFEQAFKAACTN